MKIFFLFAGIVMLFFSLTSFKISNNTNLQDEQVIDGVYDGHEDYGYNFIVTSADEEHTITFQKVDEEVLKAFNLEEKTLVGTKFKITYTTKIEVTKDDDGYEDETEINTIKKLEKL
ncbi:hypothetical protein [Litoribaculum gwangyangense]|uniref:Uncharacterized protein n=1 Tax=Litoribaculum gwangyangense TaxID=1130722 RepID=A0ABP9C692_9FLAO